MNKLNKAQLAELGDHWKAIDDARNELTEAITKYKSVVAEAWSPVGEALTKYNEAIEGAQNWRSEIHSEIESYANDRTEKWQESDAGSAYQEWVDTWGEELELLELDQPDELEDPELLDGDSFSEACPEERGG